MAYEVVLKKLCLYKLYNENLTQDFSSLNGFSLKISNHQFSEFSVLKKIMKNGSLPKLPLAQGLLHLSITQLH